MTEYVEFNDTAEEAESFLNENIELAKSWILKHVPRKTLEAWVAEKRLTVRGSEQHSISIRESTNIEGNVFEKAHDCIFLLINRFCANDRPHNREFKSPYLLSNFCKSVSFFKAVSAKF